MGNVIKHSHPRGFLFVLLISVCLPKASSVMYQAEMHAK